MTNYLRYPEFLSIQNLDDETKGMFEKNINKLINTSKNSNWESDTFLTEEQANQLERLIEYMNANPVSEKLNQNRKDFYLFTVEYDKRRKLNFEEIFPQLTKFYKLCQNQIQ